MLYFTRGYSWHDQRFLFGMVALGCDVALLSLHSAPADRKRIGVPLGVQCLDDLGGVPEDRAVVLLRRRIASFRPDVVHAGPITDCAYLAVSADMAPVVACSWAFDVLFEAANDFAMATRAIVALRKCAGLLVDCATVWQRCRELSGRDFAHCAIFPWGVDLRDEPDSSVRERRRLVLGLTDAIAVLSTRSFESLYDLSTLIRGFSIARSQDDRLRLLLLGDGTQRTALAELVDSLALTEVVYFAGTVTRSEIGNWFEAADVYASCALSDGSSVSLLEAMAFGLLPVVSALPANREWVEPGITGWLAACGDAVDFASALRKAATVSREMKHRMIAANRQIVQQRADWQENVKQLTALYEGVAGRTSIVYSNTASSAVGRGYSSDLRASNNPMTRETGKG